MTWNNMPCHHFIFLPFFSNLWNQTIIFSWHIVTNLHVMKKNESFFLLTKMY